jgi:purine-binding chemotaxis protein CheW
MSEERAKETKVASTSQYIVFRLGETRFGVEIRQVLRIVRLTPITRVPRAPHFLEGIVNYHGQAVPVVDLKKRLALSDESAYDDAARILIVELEEQTIGMLVDTVVGIARLPDEAIEPPPEMVAQVNGVYLTGVARHDDHLLVLLDLSRVLTVEEVAEVSALQSKVEG